MLIIIITFTVYIQCFVISVTDDDFGISAFNFHIVQKVL